MVVIREPGVKNVCFGIQPRIEMGIVDENARTDAITRPNREF